MFTCTVMENEHFSRRKILPAFELRDKILSGGSVEFGEALSLYDEPLEDLCAAADEIRNSFCQKNFDLCAVISVKGGRCTENCRFCPQASCSKAQIKEFELLSADEIMDRAKKLDELGISHVCLVSSGRRLSKKDIRSLCDVVRAIRKDLSVKPCASLGLIDEEDCRNLKEAGLIRLHNNLETSETHFMEVCTSHTYKEKLDLLEAAKKAGLELCCGGLLGIEENRRDRIEFAFTIKKYAPESVPLNLLYPSKGSAMEDAERLSYEEIQKTFAIFRFIFPKSELRLAAGRDLLEDTGEKCFLSGGNAAITGDCLTVKGISASEDIENIERIISEI